MLKPAILGVLVAAFLVVTSLFSGALAVSRGETTPANERGPRMEVAFVVDTTGSMGGLIEGAKKKIWSLANSIVSAKPRPILKIGLVAYRDKGDEYVTKVFPLTDNIDKVYENLMSFRAAGGGDGPEHVNKALYDVVHGLQWTKGKKVFKVVFLVGDYPPHMDYQDPYDYRKICKEAVTCGIVINTIRCGSLPETEKYWKDIAQRAEGKYATIEQSGGMVAISTPIDGELAKLNAELGKTMVAYGTASERSGVYSRQKKSEAYAPMAAAERATYCAGAAVMDKNDLVGAVESGRVKVENLKKEELPEEMQKMRPEEREAYIKQNIEKRAQIRKKIEDLSKKRLAYIQAEMKKQGKKGDSFDEKVMEFLREEASKKGFQFR